MSLSSVSSSTIRDDAHEQAALSSEKSNSAVTTADSVVSDTVSLATADASSPVSQDLSQILSALSSGNISTAKSELTQLREDLQRQDDVILPGTSVTGSSDPLASLLTELQETVNAGNTDGALQDLALAISQSEEPPATLINIAA
jgi:hypothetical protein